MASHLITLSLSAVMAMSVLPARAQEQLDPTRPPIGIHTPSMEHHADGGGLQAVLISPTRRAAIINGQTVKLGGKYGNERLVALSEGRAVLQGEYGRRELRVFSAQGIHRSAEPHKPSKQKLRIKQARVAADKGKQ